jgi:hypothetical protein
MSPPEFVSTEPCEVHLIDTSSAPVPVVRVDVRADAIREAIEVIRDTTSLAQAISLLEGLLGKSQTPGEA